jgi:hypothetical protein
MKKAVFLFDYTGLMAKPWLDAGYECWIIDGKHEPGVAREGNLVKLGMMINYKSNEYNQGFMQVLADAIGEGIEFVFGFPECTHLAVSGAKHFELKRLKDPLFQFNAMNLVYFVRDFGGFLNVPWALENPVSVISTKWRKPDFSFHPYDFGGYLPENDEHPLYPEYIKPRDAYPKKTCIWHGCGFSEPEKLPVYCDPGFSDQFKKLGGKSEKTKTIRSATPRGFARAVFESNARAIGLNTGEEK